LIKPRGNRIQKNMAGFLYFFSRLHRGGIKRAADLPAGYVSDLLEGAPIAVGPHAEPGPGGAPGVFIAPHPPAGGKGSEATCGYDPKAQDWLRIAGEPSETWVGFWRASRPTPADLVRPRTTLGRATRLGDGADWMAPILHAPQFAWHHSLPQQLRMNADGEPELARESAYDAICATAATIWEAAAEGREAPLSELDAALFAAGVLAINYRVGLWELSLLGLIDTQSQRAIADQAIGLTYALELDQKKTKAASG
jgi:hypothetical protein